jgi:hypothetical protein
LSITAASTNRLYDQTNPAFTVIIVGVTNGDTISATARCSATAASPVGNYSIVPSAAAGNDLTNYAISYTDGALTITPAPLTITADSETKAFGQTLTFAGTEFTASGLVNGDVVTSVTLTSAGAEASATVNGSPYSIIPSDALGNGLGNYEIDYVDGLLTIRSSSQPYLSFAFSRPDLTLTWPTNAGMFVLLHATSLSSPTEWIPVTSGILVDGNNNTFTISINGGSQYYKLVAQ